VLRDKKVVGVFVRFSCAASAAGVCISLSSVDNSLFSLPFIERHEPVICLLSLS
jgi:hypothetical protein